MFTLIKMTSIDNRGIYPDMVKEFVKRGHHVDYYFPSSKEFKISGINYSLNSIYIKQKFQKNTNFFFKFFTYLYIDYKFSKFIKRSKKIYDLLIIATPSIFQINIVNTFKAKYSKSKTLLLLKDIFPDNAIDLGLFNRFPFKRLIIIFFNFLELKLYKSNTFIGCMNISNYDYILRKYPILIKKLFVSPNSIAFYQAKKVDHEFFNLPKNKKVFLYVGNLGIPQNILGFKRIIEETNENLFFIVIGDGTQKSILLNLEKKLPKKLLIIPENYDSSIIDFISLNVNAGLILLNPVFRVPNFPSKLLTYINANLPIVAFTESRSELSSIISNYNVGYWEDFLNIESCIEILNKFEFDATKSNFNGLKDLYSVEKQISKILDVCSNDSILYSKF